MYPLCVCMYLLWEVRVSVFEGPGVFLVRSMVQMFIYTMMYTYLYICLGRFVYMCVSPLGVDRSIRECPFLSLQSTCSYCVIKSLSFSLYFPFLLSSPYSLFLPPFLSLFLFLFLVPEETPGPLWISGEEYFCKDLLIFVTDKVTVFQEKISTRLLGGGRYWVLDKEGRFRRNKEYWRT